MGQHIGEGPLPPERESLLGTPSHLGLVADDSRQRAREAVEYRD